MRTLTGETPFKLAMEVRQLYLRSAHGQSQGDEENKEQLCLNLDLIDKVRMDAKQRTARYKNLMESNMMPW